MVSIRHAIFEAPDETGLSIAVPTDYSLYTGSIAPDADIGLNGDWYIWVGGSNTKTYRKVLTTWQLVGTISSGSGGGVGGELNGVIITDSEFNDGTITNSLLTGCTLDGPTIANPTIAGGTIAGATISGATFVAPTLTSAILTNAIITDAIIADPMITGGTITATSITGLPNPVAPSDAVTKSYVDGVSQGLQTHESCVAATSANVNLGAAPNTLDGVTLAASDRILVKSQTSAIQNGIYVVTTLGSGSNGVWNRAADGDSGHELDTAYVLVEEGTSNGGSSWVVSGTPLIGTDAIVWTRFFAITSIPASIITGEIVAGQIGSVNASVIIGTITAGQIGSVNANTIAGTITAGQIGSVNANQIIGSITSSQIGSVTASAIVGSINSTQIGSVAATAITGSITSSQITSIAATSITGAISAGQITSLTAGQITGVIVTAQLADQILNTQRLLANDLSIIRRLAALPSLPNTDYPVGALVLNTTNKTLYQNVAGAWTVVTASSNIVGTLTATDIASVNANSITGLIIASQISSVAATSITGAITSSQIGSVSSTSIVGAITSSMITSVSASAITGSITSGQISSVSATAITGSISASQIGSVNASAITGAISASQITSVNATSITGTISSSQIASVNATTINVGSLSAIAYGIGSGTAQVSISNSGLIIAGGRISLAGDGTNPFMRVTGTGGFSGHSITINGLNGFTGPVMQVSNGSSATVNISSSGIFLSSSSTTINVGSGTNITVASGGIIQGPGGGINLFGGHASCLNIVCGEDGSAGGFAGYAVLQVNGRGLKFPFHSL